MALSLLRVRADDTTVVTATHKCMPVQAPLPQPFVVAVVVTYEPDFPGLLLQIQALRPQVQRIIIVDNASRVAVEGWCAREVPEVDECLRLPRNEGIGFAQNRGIESARRQGATHVLLMDQDSVPEADMVAKLLRALRSHPDVAAAGPYHVDPRQPISHSPFVWLHGLRFHRLPCEAASRIHVVDHLIASGCLIPLAVLEQIGMMREDFFIDFVDVEWSLRARAASLHLLGVCGARMRHSLGGPPIAFMGRSFLAYSPQRHYFQVRNAILLYRQPWVPKRWALASSWRLLLKIGFNCIAGNSRWQHFKMTVRGLWHGCGGRVGPL